jgi:pectin methylesterase-like acyl-CoA thioesterase
MANWYVAKDGDDSDGLTWATAYNAIGTAVTASANGDTIYIGAGTYDEEVDLNTANKSVTLDGIDKTAIIARTGAGEMGVKLEDDTVLKNLSISATDKSGNTTGIYGTSKSDIVIENCDIVGAYDGIALAGCSNVLLTDSSITGYNDVINISTCPGLIANNCTIHSNGTYGTGVSCRCIIGGTDTFAVFNDCTFLAERDDISNRAVAAIQGGLPSGTSTRIVLNNCLLTATAGSNNTGNVYGVYQALTENIVVYNSVITSSISGSGTAYDLYNQMGLIYVIDSAFDRTKTYGVITEASRGRRRYDCKFSYRR